MNNVQQLMEDLKKIPQNKLSFNIIRRLFIIFLYSLGFSEKKIETLLCLSRGRANYWVSNYKNNGIYFLLDKPRSGRPSFVNKEEVEILKTEIIQLNSEFNEEKVVHAQIINSIIESKTKLKKFSKSGLYKFLQRTLIRRVVPRTKHIKNDPEKMAEWIKDLPNKINEIKVKNTGKKINIDFQDESRFGQMTIKAGIWSPFPIRPEFKTQMGYLNSWIYATANKDTGKYFGMILPNLNVENMQIFINEYSKTVPKNEHIIMILDGASAHKSKKLILPQNISFIFLPSFSPELNPIERLWSYFKRNHLSFKIYKDYEDLVQKCSSGWNQLTQKIVKSIMNSKPKASLC
jgi:transposase